jgi:hypothetical protein
MYTLPPAFEESLNDLLNGMPSTFMACMRARIVAICAFNNAALHSIGLCSVRLNSGCHGLSLVENSTEFQAVCMHLTEQKLET